MASTVLVITNRDDGTADRVLHELDRRGVSVMRFDAADFPQRLALSAECGPGIWSGTLIGDHHSARLEDVVGVYFRHPGQFELPEGMTRPEQLWSYGEARLGFGGVLHALDCAWVNNPTRTAAAEYKPLQLSTAVSAGLRIPRTFIGNTPDQALAWAKAIGVEIIYKPLAGSVHTEAGSTHILYATPITDLTSLGDPSIRVTAHYFQEWIPKQAEVRVTVVGDDMFAVAIHTDSPEGRIDWRADYASHRYRVVAVPDEVRAGLRECLDRLGLVYCAADFAINPRGEWFFLGDLNPNGEWGWLAHHCDLPIAAAIADVLEGAEQ
ncbi:ATP-grasp ribosomal peptide maturase [Actinomadura harenae]|uniref:ATP-grasp ribosomal peptide maturase n=1 Tax=Actinomadura harenae TaxID=2483351 RepID=A0A3M2MBG5_9ACTN|nr:ATP-grasp ribosomal peptide maturase [Actinomadura harenae]RMI46842.1 ATP-grasp ribosomal peptide maturase [Actinomadura harenae]